MLTWITANWKTSLIGVIAIVTTVIKTWLPQYEVGFETVLGVLGGLGLVTAKDGNVSNSAVPREAATVAP